jgi:uncharacterized protein (TIGR03083 family)
MGIADLYRTAQRSFVAVVSGIGDDDWSRPVPCTPGWTVRDVLSHAAGVTIDVSEGNVEGAATDPWTAVQVERFRSVPVAELIERWDSLIDPVADALEAVGEHRPPLDCHSHEHDVRHALGRPGSRDSELIIWMSTLFADSAVGRPIEVAQPDGGSYRITGIGDPVELVGRERFDVVRSRLGRRSRDQVAGWAWSDPLTESELDSWFAFGPATVDIDE